MHEPSAAASLPGNDPERPGIPADLDAADPPHGRLSERYRQLLEFEEQWPRHGGLKNEAIRSAFGISAARYYQLLNVVMDSPAAFQYDPLLVSRLQRIRDRRRSARSLAADAG